MFKKRFISMLVLLMTAATGAWADTTVTWTASDISRIHIDFLDGEAFNNTIKGITVTSSGGGGAGSSWEGTDINLSGGSTTITFASSVGNIKSIAIKAGDIDMSSISSGWTTDYNSNLSWSGEASTTVSLPLSGWTEISGISEIVFTIESTVNVTGITLDKTEASMIVGGETLTLTPTVAPGNATDKTVTWTTSDAGVATVVNGVVTAVAAGTATITATATNGTADTSDDFSATCEVTVSPAGYSVALKEGTDDAANWQGKAGEGEYQALPLEGVAANTAVTVKYNGTKKVKSVKAVKKASASIPLDNTTTAWTAGTYAVPAGGLTYSDAITVSGDVTLTLTDGETLTLNKGISLAEGATLTIQGNGTMNINGTSGSTASTVAGSTGTLILTSGTLTATGGNGGSVDDFRNESHGGNGGDAINGSVIVSGGTLTARGGNGGSVGLMGDYCSGGNGGDAINGSVIVSGGTLTARGGNGGSVADDSEDSHGGNGGDAISGTLTKNGGSTSVNDGSNGSIGSECDGCTAGKGGKGHN